MWTRALIDCDAAWGGKAYGLARLAAAGLCVPEGFAISDGAFRIAAQLPDELALDELGHRFDEAHARIEHVELPDSLIGEVTSRARTLGEPFAVRSSATLEDSDTGSAAGLFSTRTAISLGELWSAIRFVWARAVTPLVARYARERGASGFALSVIVQRYVEGQPVILYTRPPGAPTRDEMWIQRAAIGDREARIGPADPGVRLDRVPRSGGGDAQILANAVERAIDAERGVDAELVLPAPDAWSRAWIVQARAIIHPIVRSRTPPPPAVLAPLHDGRTWTWDIRHNPDPLSPAQAGLVERIDQAGLAPWSMRVCGGYLYTAPRATPPVVAPPREELVHALDAIEARLARALGEGASPNQRDDLDRPVPLEEALERYLAFYVIWANELSPLIDALKVPRTGTQPTPGERPSAVEATLLAAARGELVLGDVLARLGVLAPAWDVAVPTYGETTEILIDAIERARIALATASNPKPAASAHTFSAAELAERDDHWFARAQWMVRRAILDRASSLGIERDDACWLPLELLVEAHEIDPIDPIQAHRQAGAQRRAVERAASWTMPLVVGGLAPDLPSRPLHGVGVGPRVSGRVVRFASLTAAIAVRPGDVVVTRAVTPALAVLVIGCAAIVSETGGVLDHGAAMARELGIPCVVGCHDAWSLLSDGMLVTVDGDGGVVWPA
jgi:phosphohistidine swiveling domain-containing protein